MNHRWADGPYSRGRTSLLLESWRVRQARRLEVILQTHRARLLLATIPVVVFTIALAVAPRARPKAEVPVKTYLEQVAPNSFSERYGEEVPMVRKVPTTRITRETEQAEVVRPPAEVPPPRAVFRDPPPPPQRAEAEEPPRRGRGRVRIIRRSGGDICARHNMRKVWVSDKRWRCRK